MVKGKTNKGCMLTCVSPAVCPCSPSVSLFDKDCFHPFDESQVVTIATYSYFVACTIGRQYLNPKSDEVDYKQLDLYFPGFTLLEFVFYVGWLKVRRMEGLRELLS